MKWKSKVTDVECLESMINKTHWEQQSLFLPEVPADLPDDFQSICYLLLLNIVQFHPEASTGKQHSPASPNEATKGRGNQERFPVNLVIEQFFIPTQNTSFKL